ncbi:MAG: carboxypeptidase-like regulatory domain-containing protein, partial [Candidatus Acidiferrum sp.]
RSGSSWKGKGEIDTMRFYRFIALTIVVFLSAGHSQAQSTISGYVTGIVTDPSKGAVANAKVLIENAATSLRQSGTTGSDGSFHFEYVPPGNYTLTITANGFNTWSESIVVTVGQSTTANASLTIGSSVSSVTVSVANSCLCRDWRVKESTTMATPTIRFQGRADVELRRFLRCFAGETGVTSMQIVIVPELR